MAITKTASSDAAAAAGEGDGAAAAAAAAAVDDTTSDDGAGDGSANGEGDAGDAGGAGAGEGEGGDDAADAASGSSDEGDDGANPQGAPDSYELDDYAELGDSVLDAVSEAAKKLGLPQKAVSELLGAVLPKSKEQGAARIEEWKAGLMKDAKKHPDLGGKDWEKNRATALRGIEAVHAPLLDLLKESGLENHKDVLLLGKRLGELVADDADVVPPGGDGDNQDGGPLTFSQAAKRIYGKKKR
ncbi:MAG: hypothetical protein KDE27_02445 [Planctomycetes bacterium]|nr:hypothetical protein [Planctomycetota bacterium]